jgi:phosphopantothenoylcysteine decarboxylase/phosphopantothenate--cysteine ligase
MLISAGPTREPIDPVRFISNYSTGYMGARLAAEAMSRGHRVTVVSGPSVEPLPVGSRVIPAGSASDMEAVLRREAPRSDVIIMAAAVSDYRPARAWSAKLPRRGQLTLRLKATPDIIARLPRRPNQVVVGFALESRNPAARAAKKVRTKRLDLLLAQQVSGLGGRSPFGRRQVRAWLVARDGSAVRLGRVSKLAVARALLDKIEALWYGQREPQRADAVAAR